MKKKRGISPLIATVMLIGFVIAVSSIVFLWGQGYIQERAEKEGKLAEKKLECESVDFTVTQAIRTAGLVDLVLKNKKSDKLGKFTFRVVGRETQTIDDATPLDGLAIQKYNIAFAEDVIGTRIKEVDIIPWLKVARGYFIPCSTKVVKARVQ
jgi:flagellin-like protein